MKYVLAISVLLISWASTATAAEYPNITLDKLLSADEQRLMGVSKLSAQEKERLRLLLIEKYLAGYEAGHKKGIEDAIAHQSRQQSTPDVIESQIDGEFSG